MVEESGTSNIRVLCRFRPLNEREKQEFPDQMCAEFLNDNQSFIIHPQSEHNDAHQFKFDYVFSPAASQESVYQIAAKPIVEAVMQGFNGTVFAYGQTSSGKTFTMSGLEDQENQGIIPRMVSTVFNRIRLTYSKIEFQVKLSFCEIYMEKIKDLLDPTKTNLKIHEEKTRGVYIADLTEQYITNETELFELMKIGNKNREVGYTNMNSVSSRSHSIFSLTITQTSLVDLSAKTGKLYLVDLAGSEKVGKTKAAGKRLEEAKNINKSLTMLGLVIAALTDPKAAHIPYRDSKLTRILQDSLGGNSKTALIVTCSPSPYNESETISTCRFGIRARSIKNKPKVNREYTIAELKLMLSRAREEISRKNRIILALEKALGRSYKALPQTKAELENSPDAEEEDECNETKMTGAYDEVITELEEYRNKLEEEVLKNKSLSSTIESLLKENKELKDDHEFIHKQIIDLQERLAVTEDSVRLKEDSIERLTVTNEALKKDLEAEDSKKLSMELQILKAELETTKKKLQQSNMLIEQENQQLKSELIEEKQKNADFLVDMENMHTNIKQLIAGNANTIDQNALKILEESHNNIKSRWQEEKKTIMKELHTRIDKLISTQNKLEESDKKYNLLKSSLSESEKVARERSDTLERNLEQLTLMYHQFVSKESSFKVDKKVSERKVQRLTDKVNALDKETRENRDVIEKLKHENTKITAELKELREFKQMMQENVLSRPVSIIKKTIKGGVPEEPNPRLSCQVYSNIEL
jgi:kinesin family member 5